jgi:hypothetical protein
MTCFSDESWLDYPKNVTECPKLVGKSASITRPLSDERSVGKPHNSDPAESDRFLVLDPWRGHEFRSDGGDRQRRSVLAAL